MGQKIRLSESQLKKIIAESVKRTLAENINEISPEFYKEKSDSAREKMDKLPARLKGFFNPKWKAKKEGQIDLLHDYSEDHPDDEWTAEDYDSTVYKDIDTDWGTFRNKRTGETVKYHSPYYQQTTKPFRGKVVKPDTAEGDGKSYKMSKGEMDNFNSRPYSKKHRTK